MRSKKRSGASSPSPPESRPVLFVDRSLGRRRIVDALRHAGANVVHHDDHFPPATPDEEWLTAVGRRGWIVLTKDIRIRYKPNEKEAILEAGAVAVILVSGNMKGEEMAELFVRSLGHIERVAGRATPPAIFTLGRDGRLKLKS
jgi:predicted nuclease of predicted toxin-antitoxin system